MFHRGIVFDVVVVVVVVVAAAVALVAVCLTFSLWKSISTSPPGGNQVDGLPPVCSNLLTRSYLCSSGRPSIGNFNFVFSIFLEL